MSVFPGPVTWAVTSRVSPSSFLKLAPVYCLSVFLLRCSGKAGGLAARGPFSWVGRGWGGTRGAACPARAGLCFGEALGVFTPSPPPAAGGSGTLLGSSPEKPATGRVLGPQDVPTVARPTLAASSRSSPPGGPTAAGSAHASRRPALTFAPPSLPFPPDLGVAARFATSVVWRV